MKKSGKSEMIGNCRVCDGKRYVVVRLFGDLFAKKPSIASRAKVKCWACEGSAAVPGSTVEDDRREGE
jgi:hypothetical protein